jgi:poly(A) polymerase
MIPPRLAPLLAGDSPAIELARLFSAAGHDLYLVGGSVRDAFLGRESVDQDLDFTTVARPDEVQRIVGPWADEMYLVGAAFGTIGAIKRGLIHEITTFRSEVYRDDSRKPNVSFSDDIETDLSRRDFTVNAMALRLPGSDGDEPILVDPFGGMPDLLEARLATPMDPSISFGDDPLRMLRLFRFMSTLGFTADQAALDAVVEMADRLDIISAERIREELSKLVVGEHVARALWGCVESGLAEHFMPEVPALGLEQDPVHRHKDVLAHTIAVVEKTEPDLELRLAALFHDIGKPATRRFIEGGVAFHHHEVVGARMTRERMRALRFSKAQVDEVSELVFLHMRPHTYKMGWTDAAVRRYVRDAGPYLAKLNQLVRCDVTTRNRKRAGAISRRIDELEDRIVELREREAIDSLRPPIDGRRVMEYLGLEPGPKVGEVMRILYEHRIEHGPYDEQEALVLLDEWRAGLSDDGRAG